MDVILFDLARRGTPGNNSAVFGVVLQQGAKLALIGTAFAVNQKLAISAWHNFIESNFQTGDVVYLCKELCQGIILKSSPQVNVREYDVIEDWVVMELISGDSVLTSRYLKRENFQLTSIQWIPMDLPFLLERMLG